MFHRCYVYVDYVEEIFTEALVQSSCASINTLLQTHHSDLAAAASGYHADMLPPFALHEFDRWPVPTYSAFQDNLCMTILFTY